QRALQGVGRQLRDEDRDAEGDRRRDEQRENRRVQRAPDERQRAELPRNGIPPLGAPEVQPELLDRRQRLPRQLHGNRDDDGDQDAAEEPDGEAKPEVAAFLHIALSSELMTP